MAVPGVLLVLTGADYLADGLRPLMHSPFAVNPPDIYLRNSDGSESFIAPHYPLAHDRVRYVGEGVALVVAETLAAAQDAAELVEVEYDMLPAATDGREAADPKATTLWPVMESNVVLDARTGDAEATEAAFRTAHFVVRIETHVPLLV